MTESLETGTLTKLLEGEGGGSGGVVTVARSIASLFTGDGSSENTISMLDPTDFLAGLVGLPGIGDLVNKAIGGGVTHRVAVPGLVVPENLADIGINAAPIHASSYRHYGERMHAILAPLIANKQTIQAELRVLGLASTPLGMALSRAGNAAGRDATSPAHQGQLNQTLINVISQVRGAIDLLNANRSQFLADNPDYQKVLNLFVAQNPVKTQDITNSYWNLIGNKDAPTAIADIQTYTKKANAELYDLLKTAFPAPTTAPTITPAPKGLGMVSGLPRSSSSTIIPVNPQASGGLPYNININVSSIPTTQPGTLTQAQQQTWWTKTKSRILTGSRIASGVNTILSLPSYVGALFGESGEGEAFYGGYGDLLFPEYSYIPPEQQAESFAEYVPYAIQPADETKFAQIETYKEEQPITLSNTFTGNKILIPILIGIAAAYILSRRKR